MHYSITVVSAGTQLEIFKYFTQYTDYATQFIIQLLYSVQDTQVENCKYLPHYRGPDLVAYKIK